MKEIVFINVNFIGNAGDFWSSPLKYYDFSKFNVRQVHFMDVWGFVSGNEDYNFANITNSLVILGGGGLITTTDNFIQKTTEYLIKNNKVILWGVGSNTNETPSFNILNHENILLSGIRDITYGLNLDYLPCVSCKHPIFDNRFEITDKVGIIEHIDLPVNINIFPKIKNDESIDNLIKFISSKEIIVSTTYHGTYWSQLLNKKVVYFSESDKINSKIINLKHRVPICNTTNFIDPITYTSRSDGMLYESRHLNDMFYKKVIKILDEYQQ
jgi:hypothetical protein